ncbi:non-homologous end joining protein Ku [Parenemella sanctibonifatiensis]|uniref:Non-homologous end joining protein Ku n=1 Tax=Parenemella sanctibonifatiensis TaxID=2016505 RepID=A0A255E1J6_9ACTN|nr:Ku protein [Parenemella sanctibonifatiensis]OYN85414.1 Ku protein [Parenemella sanctibonifatiensis]
MPRSIWKGAISFGLISIPVKVYGATETKDLSFRQIHAEDEGRIRYKRVCEKCDKEIPYGDIAKGYEAADGRLAILEKGDFDDLPLTTTKTVDIHRFIDAAEVDPTYFEKTYVLEADGPGTKPYVLLRDALIKEDQAALVKVALRNRESLALIRVRDDVLLMHTMLWPDELRDTGFAAPPAEVTVSEEEVAMATSFIEQLHGEFEPDTFTDAYRDALEEVVMAKLDGADLPETSKEQPSKADVVDLVAALRASVDAAKAKREAS